MTEYIDRKEFIEAVKDIPMWGSVAVMFVDSIPAADVSPVVHARWITRSDKGIVSMTHPYMCSRCWRVEMNKEPYCNCGAKMDREG